MNLIYKGEWKSIKMAPKDGKRILLMIEGVNRPVVAFWNGVEWSTIDCHDWRGKNILYWTEFPKIPTDENKIRKS